MFLCESFFVLIRSSVFCLFFLQYHASWSVFLNFKIYRYVLGYRLKIFESN